jgi:molybdenum cofactor cytidylyltransferase
MQFFAIIPAAGRSQRMGRPKLLLPWRDKTVIEHVLDVWRASQVTQAVLIVHPLDEPLAALGLRSGAIVVRPEIAPGEMKDSVRVGLDYVARKFRPGDDDAWLLAPADMPTLSTATIDRLIDAYRATAGTGDAARRTIWAPAAGPRRGHPVLFPWPLAAALENLSPEEGLNALLKQFPVATIEADASAILEDLDTAEDYERLKNDRDSSAG